MGFCAVVVAGFEIYFWVHLLLVFCIRPHAYLFSLFSPFSSAWVARQKNFHVFYVSLNLYVEELSERASPEKKKQSRECEREAEGKNYAN